MTNQSTTRRISLLLSVALVIGVAALVAINSQDGNQAKAQPTANCNDCHSGAADDDYVFTQYYPVLRAAKGSSNPK